MKRTRAQQPKVVQEPQDAAAANHNPKPQRRAKQPRQPKGAAKKPTATVRGAAVAAAATAAGDAAAAASPGAETAPTVPDVCSIGEGEADAHTVEWDLDGGISNGSWWTWGVEEEKLLGWFPFVEEDFRCLGGRGGDAEVAFDDDIWRIHQIYEIPNYAAK
ncbi:uncharacterized protein LOC133900324 [Phragmites australis]|uniref:uncharacterized protein LOC133900324 n=1 Tax=Phragmites australis TaxID=29695 RepID=UPI002D7899CD|nr:uncharacterized protein LOC133900324 [Phragmites australis]